jgi:hypothetical protein
MCIVYSRECVIIKKRLVQTNFLEEKKTYAKAAELVVAWIIRSSSN